MKESLKSKELIILLVLLFADFITKFFLKETYLILFSNVGFVGVINTGMIFGFLVNQNLLMLFLMILFLIILVYFYFNNKQYSFGLIFIIAGALGNLIDRIIYGGVVDFIHLGFWPSFNLADIFVVFGVVYCLFKSRKS